MAEFATSSDLKKAFITPYDASGKLSNTIIPVLFNPTEYTIEKSNQFAEVDSPQLDSPLLTFTRGNVRTLSMDLFFDTYTDGRGEDVRNHTDKITDLLKVGSDLHAPPVCLFSWGKLTFPCVLEKATQRFIMFNADGLPVRARLSVVFKEYTAPDKQLRITPRNSPDRTKRRIVKQGDSLWLWAAREYGDATKWRAIADKNEIENPRFLEPGTEISIPPL